MKYETFVKRLEKGKSNHHIYKKDGSEGLISIWKCDKIYILALEECEEGYQFDEPSYTKDDRYEFKTIDEIIIYLENNSLSVDLFTP